MSLEGVRKQRKKEALGKSFTQAELASVLNVSRPTYYKLANHPKEMTVEQMQRVCKHLGCTEKDILKIDT